MEERNMEVAINAENKIEPEGKKSERERKKMLKRQLREEKYLFKHYKYILIIVSVGLLLFMVVFLINAKEIGSGIGENYGQMVGFATGSYKGITKGLSEGAEAGKEQGLSAEDTKVYISTPLYNLCRQQHCR